MIFVFLFPEYSQIIKGFKVDCYDIKEIAAEKIRAVLTRPIIQERDLLDLFFISERISIGNLDKKKIVNKITDLVVFMLF